MRAILTASLAALSPCVLLAHHPDWFSLSGKVPVTIEERVDGFDVIIACDLSILVDSLQGLQPRFHGQPEALNVQPLGHEAGTLGGTRVVILRRRM